MHSCKETRKLLIEQALDQMPSDQSQTMLAELEHCAACREEFASLRSVLRVANQAMESALPAENFWSGYHARLQQSLERDSSSAPRPRTESGALVLLRSLLQRLATASVRVPVPVAAVLIILFGLSIVFAMHSRRQPTTESPSGTSTVVTKTVEVPVIQQRTVTRVVYRDRSRHTVTDIARIEKAPRSAAKLTNRTNEPVANTPISLVGFKPTSDPKLTIIKGSYRDEK
jgi:hypothetical protein